MIYGLIAACSAGLGLAGQKISPARVRFAANGPSQVASRRSRRPSRYLP